MAAIKNRPGPPVHIKGLTVVFVNMTGDAPHGGELHSDQHSPAPNSQTSFGADSAATLTRPEITRSSSLYRTER